METGRYRESYRNGMCTFCEPGSGPHEAALSACLATRPAGNRRLDFAGKRTEVVRQPGE
jgi:hypothetical protein